MKSRRIVLAVVLVIAVLFFVVSLARRHASSSRQLRYQAILRSYSTDLKPGAARDEVEGYLRARKLEFKRIGLQGNAYSDLVKIGEERAPWYCSEQNIYIEFAFTPGASRTAPDAASTDRLREIRQFPMLENCL